MKRNPEKILNSLTQHSSDLAYKFERLYRLLFNEEMYCIAYLSARFGGECLETYRVKTRKGTGYLAYGQIASAKILLSRMISPQLYWVMFASEFTFDINNPEEPRILCVGNNPDRQNIYGAALGLYNSRIVKLINKKGMLKSSVIIDELPTIYFKGLDNLIATARSNKVAVCLGFQDFSQLKRDYGDKEAAVVMNTVGNDRIKEKVQENYNRIKDEVKQIVRDELERIANDDSLKHLLQLK